MQPMPDDELDLRHYLDVLRRRKWAVVVSLVVVVAVAMALTLQQTPRYRASTEVLLRQSTSEDILSGSQSANNLSNTRVAVATEIAYMESGLVESSVAEKLGYEPSVSIRPEGDTQVVRISATSELPERAAEAAEVYAQTYIDERRAQLVAEFAAAADKVQSQIDSLEDELDLLEAPIDLVDARIARATEDAEILDLLDERDDLVEEIAPQRDALLNRLNRARDQLTNLDLQASGIETGGAQLISSAEVPASPYAPTPLRNGVVAVVIGLILGVGVAFLFETLDDGIRTRADLEQATGWPVIGLIPVQEDWKDDGVARMVTREHPGSAPAEAYRTLRTSVQFLGIEREMRSLVITSAKQGEGKTTTMANLGMTLARAGNRVILMDCDLRRPRLHDFFGLSNEFGLTSVLLGQVALGDIVKPTAEERRLAVLTAGPTPPNPSELLALPAMRRVFTSLRDQCDFLLLDAPPVLPVTDPAVLSGMVDGVIVVTNARKTKAQEVTRAAELLGQVNAPVIGTVVNAVSQDSGGYGYGYGYYGSSYKTQAPTTSGPVSPDPLGSNDIFDADVPRSSAPRAGGPTVEQPPPEPEPPADPTPEPAAEEPPRASDLPLLQHRLSDLRPADLPGPEAEDEPTPEPAPEPDPAPETQPGRETQRAPESEPRVGGWGNGSTPQSQHPVDDGRGVQRRAEVPSTTQRVARLSAAAVARARRAAQRRGQRYA